MLSTRDRNNSTNILGVNLQELKGLETSRDRKSLRIARKRGSHVHDLNTSRRAKVVDENGRIRFKMPPQIKELMGSFDNAKITMPTTNALQTPRGDNDFRALSSRDQPTQHVVPLANETHMPLQNQYMLNRDLSEEYIRTEVVLSQTNETSDQVIRKDKPNQNTAHSPLGRDRRSELRSFSPSPTNVLESRKEVGIYVYESPRHKK